MTKIGPVRVPNEGPLDSPIYLVGEAPGAEEVELRRPFTGISGSLLRDCLARNGISDTSVRFNNLCQYRPQDNKFTNVLNSKELLEGLEELAVTIRTHKPNVVVALGAWPLYYLTGKGKDGKGINKWRGSILPCTLPGCETVKVVPTFHPAYIVRTRGDYPIFDSDIRRVKEESLFPEFNYPEYNFTLNPPNSLLDELADELLSARYFTVDIESVKGSTHILCIGYSPSPSRSIVVPYSYSDFAKLSFHQRILTSSVPKVLHNASFDRPMVWMNDIEMKNVVWDTMVAQHVMWPELPKALEYLTSIYTRQPYYKTEGRAEIPSDTKNWDRKFDKNALYLYNAKDTAVTAAIYEAQLKEMEDGPEGWREIFEFEMESLSVAESISLEGMPIDFDYRDLLRTELKKRWAILQLLLNSLTGFETNVNSTKFLPKILYDKDKMGLPPRKNRKGNLTTDEDAIVSLIGTVKDKVSKLKPGGSANKYWDTRLTVLKVILEIRGIRKLLSSYINIRLSDDGKARTQYKVTGTTTGRWSASKFYDGTGYNGQTTPREAIEIKDYSKSTPLIQSIISKIDEMESEPEEEEDDEELSD